MSAHVLQLLALIASLVIFFRVEPVVNLMGHACRLPVRVAFWLLAVGSAWLALSITQGYRPNGGVVLVLLGVAMLVVLERRIRGLLRLPDRVTRDRRAHPW